MSVPYWHHSGCGRNTEIPEEVLERVRNKEGSLDDLMTCKHCGSTPEKRKEAYSAIWDGMKRRVEEKGRLRRERAEKEA